MLFSLSPSKNKATHLHALEAGAFFFIPDGDKYVLGVTFNVPGANVQGRAVLLTGKNAFSVFDPGRKIHWVIPLQLDTTEVEVLIDNKTSFTKFDPDTGLQAGQLAIEYGPEASTLLAVKWPSNGNTDSISYLDLNTWQFSGPPMSCFVLDQWGLRAAHPERNPKPLVFRNMVPD